MGFFYHERRCFNVNVPCISRNVYRGSAISELEKPRRRRRTYENEKSKRTIGLISQKGLNVYYTFWYFFANIRNKVNQDGIVRMVSLISKIVVWSVAIIATVRIFSEMLLQSL